MKFALAVLRAGLIAFGYVAMLAVISLWMVAVIAVLVFIAMTQAGRALGHSLHLLPHEESPP